WSDVNPHATRDRGFQRRFSVNVWCGIIETKIIGPFFFNGHLNGNRYLEFLQTTFSEYLRDLPLLIFRDIIFQQDGAPAHNTRAVVNFLNDRFSNRWMDTNGPMRWPPRSPDLTPCDFFLWGYIKDIVYAIIPENEEDLRYKITRAVEGITAEMLQSTMENVIKRVECCIEHDGNTFEQLM
ncbi:Transposable element Tc3 transposase, partial [Camponotus floridanus]